MHSELPLEPEVQGWWPRLRRLGSELLGYYALSYPLAAAAFREAEYANNGIQACEEFLRQEAE